MLKRIIKGKWWLCSGVIVFLIVRSFEPFKSNVLLAMVLAGVIGIVTVVLMAIIPKTSQ